MCKTRQTQWRISVKIAPAREKQLVRGSFSSRNIRRRLLRGHLLPPLGIGFPPGFRLDLAQPDQSPAK
jgi:hypothetical protein